MSTKNTKEHEKNNASNIARRFFAEQMLLILLVALLDSFVYFRGARHRAFRGQFALPDFSDYPMRLEGIDMNLIEFVRSVTATPQRMPWIKYLVGGAHA